MNKKIIQGNGFTVKESKFDYFFGRVISTFSNTQRSLQNKETLKQLGIDETKGGREKLLILFKEGLTAPEVVDNRKINNYGTSIVRQIEINFHDTQGVLLICYFYAHHDLSSIPQVTSIIPKIYNTNRYENSNTPNR